MFRNFIILCVCCSLFGCIGIYDPATGAVNVFNNTDSAVYLYQTYMDSLPLEHGLSLFWSGSMGVDECNNSHPDTTSPDYRINAYAWSSFQGYGTPNRQVLDKDKGERLNLFFIKETTMRTKTWKEIYEGQLYSKKMSFTEKQLDSVCWRVIYKSD